MHSMHKTAAKGQKQKNPKNPRRYEFDWLPHLTD